MAFWRVAFGGKLKFTGCQIEPELSEDGVGASQNDLESLAIRLAADHVHVSGLGIVDHLLEEGMRKL